MTRSEEMESEKEKIMTRLAPCGLHCGGCFAFAEGDIRRHAALLRDALEGFEVYAQRFVGMLDEPLFAKYPDFKAFLDLLAQGSCRGCRKERCKLFAGCRIRACSEERGVDFCFQCREFPCGETGFDAHLARRSEAINRRLRDEGAAAYYEAVKDIPRYK